MVAMELPQHIHIIGIGGIGISALARMFAHQGKNISGTNDSESPETLDELRSQGVPISLSLEPDELPAAECYIYSDAWLTNHPEVIDEARSRGVPVLSYFEALGAVTKGYELIAVTGAHGKTTTTAMLTDVLEAGGLDPTAVIGSLRAKTRSNFRAGESKYFIVEADEYRRHFLHFLPKILVILNIDTDHLDYYKDTEDIQGAFRELAEKVPQDGCIVYDSADENTRAVLKNLVCTLVDYRPYFDPALSLKVLPLHRMNAAAVLAVADILHINQETAKKTLADFSGTWRRFEYKGKTKNGALVYDDYAHHPKEIETTLRSVREQFPGKKIIVAFHPHLFSRTRALMNGFAAAFEDADDILIAPIFPAREAPDPAVTSEILANKITEHGKQAKALTFDEIETYLRSAGEGDLILTMGAGDIYKVAEKLTK